MPRYYFDVHDGFELTDDAGREIEGIEGARIEAMKMASELSLAESPEKDGYTIVVEVRDDQGHNVLTVRLICQIDDRPTQRLKFAS